MQLVLNQKILFQNISLVHTIIKTMTFSQGSFMYQFLLNLKLKFCVFN